MLTRTTLRYALVKAGCTWTAKHIERLERLARGERPSLTFHECTVPDHWRVLAVMTE